MDIFIAKLAEFKGVLEGEDIKLSGTKNLKSALLNFSDNLEISSEFEIFPIRLNKKIYTYEISTIEGVLACILHAITENYSFDIGYLSSESNFGEMEAEEIAEALKEQKGTIVVPLAMIMHKNSSNIAYLLAQIAKITKSEIALEIGALDLDIEKIKGIKSKIEPKEIILEEYNGNMLYLQYQKDLKEPILEANAEFLSRLKLQKDSRGKIKFKGIYDANTHEIEAQIVLSPLSLNTIAVLKINKILEIYPYARIFN